MAFSTDLPPYLFRAGTRPLLISMPHAGTYLPPALASRMTEEARHVPDTDWHLERLYSFADSLGASVLKATHSRYVIDLNRPPDGASLYPGRSVTALCPLDTFDGTPVYLQGDAPQDGEIAERRAAVWRPYHDKLVEELARIKARYGVAALWDAHSIRSVLPRFFSGRLPDLNLGTNNGASCDPRMGEAVLLAAAGAHGLLSVLNRRYIGGYITRHYGRPANGVHAIQLEMAQCSYMQEHPPFDYLSERAARVQPHLERMVQAVISFVELNAGARHPA